MKIELNEDRLRDLSERVQIYFRDEHDESMGELKTSLIIDFFIKELGPHIYNQAINDAHAFIQDKLIDLEGSLYISE
jgi:uncharacterized protein (DUF2164 family)